MELYMDISPPLAGRKNGRHGTFQVKVLLTVWDEVVLRVCRSAFFGQAWLPPVTALAEKLELPLLHQGEVGELLLEASWKYPAGPESNLESQGSLTLKNLLVRGVNGPAYLEVRVLHQCGRGVEGAGDHQLLLCSLEDVFNILDISSQQRNVGFSFINQQNWGSCAATVGFFMYFITKTRDLHGFTPQKIRTSATRLSLPISIPKAGTKPGTNPARLTPADAISPVLKVATPRPRSLVGARMGDVYRLSRGFFHGIFHLGIFVIFGVSIWGMHQCMVI